MTIDVLGPASTNAVTVRPDRTNIRGATNTWFKDCSDPSLDDGTQFSADWFNDVLAQLRTTFVSASITLDNGDDMLWRAILAAIPSDLITTAVTKTVGVGQDFPTLADAFIWATRYKITSTGSLKLQLTGAVHSITGGISLAHANSDRIRIEGAALVGGFPAIGSFTQTGSSAPARASDTASNLGMLRSHIPTEIRFAGAAGMSLVTDGFNLVNLLITGDGSNTSGIVAYANCALSGVVLAGFGGYGLQVIQAGITIVGAMAAIGNGSANIQLGYGSSLLHAGDVISLSSAGNGVEVVHGANFAYGNAGGGHLSSNRNANHGIYAVQQGAFSFNADSEAKYNGGSGAMIANDSVLNSPGMYLIGNASDGLTASRAKVIINGARIQSNTGNGIYAIQSEIEAGGSDFSGNGALTAAVEYNTSAKLVSCTNVGSLSPAANTVGNHESLIATV